MYRRGLLIAAAAVLAGLPLTFGTFWINMVITALIFSLAVFSINLLTGLTGLLSFGQAGFVGIGAYTLGVLAKQGHPPILAGLYGVLLAMLCGFLLGLPAARLKGQLSRDRHTRLWYSDLPTAHQFGRHYARAHGPDRHSDRWRRQADLVPHHALRVPGDAGRARIH